MASNNLPDPVIPEIPESVRIIGLGHKAGSGKDTVADILEFQGQQKGMTVFRTAFAKHLKDSARVLFGLSQDDINTQQGKETIDSFWGVSHRRLLQLYGTECVRKGLHEDFWVLVLLSQIVRASSLAKKLLVIVTDVRFPNEANALQRAGGTVWRIDRPSVFEREKNLLAQGHTLHESETALDNYELWDRFINNDGTLQDLARTVIEAMDF